MRRFARRRDGPGGQEVAGSPALDTAESDDRPDEATAPRLRVVHDDAYPSWEAIYRDNVDRLYRLMFAKVGNRQDAEDLTTEVFLAALRPLRTTASVGEVRAYLLATARTVLASHWRRTLGTLITSIEVTDLPDVHGAGLAGAPGADPAADVAAAHRAGAILAELPERSRSVLELRFLHGYSLREAADELGVTVANAKVLQHRALRSAADIATRMEGQ